MMETELRDSINEIVEEHKSAMELFLSNCRESLTDQDRIIEKNKIDQKLLDLQERARDVLQNREDIEDQYKRLDLLWEPAILELFGKSDIEEKKQQILKKSKLDFKDLKPIIGPLMQLEFIAEQYTDIDLQKGSVYGTLVRIVEGTSIGAGVSGDDKK